MPIGGSATELNITGAKLKVSGGVQVSGSIAYTTDATGFGGVTAQIDGNNTLNITSGKLTGVTKIDRSTAATITAITHTNVNNNTTIHIALKNISSTRGVFITLGTFASDDTVKVNYTDDYLIGPGETGMLTLRKVNNVLSLFAREMFSDKASTFTNDATNGNRPFYIKDGVNYKYPLYKYSIGGSDLTSIVIGGTTYYRPSTGITTKSRPPKGLPDNTPVPSGTLKIGNNGDMTTINYDVYSTGNSEAGSIYRGSTQKTRFGLDTTHNEASGSFTDSGVSSGDTYTLYLDKTATTSTDTVSASGGAGKNIPKVTDIVLDPTNVSNVLISTQGTGISTITYSVDSGSEVSTPVSQLSVAHGLAINNTGTLLAYALDASSARLGVKLSRSITSVYGYETITLLTKSSGQTITYVDNGTTDVTNTYKSAGGDTWNSGWYMDTGYTAPVTFEYKASASSSDDGNSYKQIGINDAIVQTYASEEFDIFHYAFYQSALYIDGTDVTQESVATSWNSTDTFYIVYKTNGDVEWWQAGTKFKTVSWGTGKTAYLSTTLWKQGNGSDNGSFKNIRIKRRQWDGTKYIN